MYVLCVLMHPIARLAVLLLQVWPLSVCLFPVSWHAENSKACEGGGPRPNFQVVLNGDKPSVAHAKERRIKQQQKKLISFPPPSVHPIMAFFLLLDWLRQDYNI